MWRTVLNWISCRWSLIGDGSSERFKCNAIGGYNLLRVLQFLDFVGRKCLLSVSYQHRALADCFLKESVETPWRLINLVEFLTTTSSCLT